MKTIIVIPAILAISLLHQATASVLRNEIIENGLSENILNTNDRIEGSRGLLDILENFRLWQQDRRNQVSTTTSKPTPEPQGLEVFLPRLPSVSLDQNTFANVLTGLSNAVADAAKSFVGPPSTSPAPTPDPTLNASTAMPPNELFCFFCQ